MKYRCLVLDHDDTVVNSTAAVHYPPFVAALKALRPGITLSLEDYFLFNFDPGFSAYCDNVLHFTKAEQAWQEENWLRYVADHVPSAYPGMRETLLRFRAEGCFASCRIPFERISFGITRRTACRRPI